MTQPGAHANRGSWKQCLAITVGLGTLLATQVATVWALNGMLLG